MPWYDILRAIHLEGLSYGVNFRPVRPRTRDAKRQERERRERARKIRFKFACFGQNISKNLKGLLFCAHPVCQGSYMAEVAYDRGFICRGRI